MSSWCHLIGYKVDWVALPLNVIRIPWNYSFNIKLLQHPQRPEPSSLRRNKQIYFTFAYFTNEKKVLQFIRRDIKLHENVEWDWHGNKIMRCYLPPHKWCTNPVEPWASSMQLCTESKRVASRSNPVYPLAEWLCRFLSRKQIFGTEQIDRGILYRTRNWHIT